MNKKNYFLFFSIFFFMMLNYLTCILNENRVWKWNEKYCFMFISNYLILYLERKTRLLLTSIFCSLTCNTGRPVLTCHSEEGDFLDSTINLKADHLHNQPATMLKNEHLRCVPLTNIWNVSNYRRIKSPKFIRKISTYTPNHWKKIQ